MPAPTRPLPEGHQTPVTGDALRVVNEGAREARLDTGQTVLVWMGQREHPVLPVVGVSTPEQLHSAVDAVTTALPAETLDRLDAARSGA